MDPEKLRIIVEEAIKNANPFSWWSYLVLMIIVRAGAFFGAYLRQKGKNFATKEDTAEITRRVEEIRIQFARNMEEVSQQNRLLLEEYRTRNQLRLAAIDRRLQAHQEAYTLWRRLISNVYNRVTITNTVIECQDWWDRNCIYLEPGVREAFFQSYVAASNHADLVQARADAEDIRRNWSVITRIGELIPETIGFISIEGLEVNVSLPDGQERET